jgi:hypothetical protein
MSKYTELLEFFMQNGISLDKDQMDEIKSIIEYNDWVNEMDSILEAYITEEKTKEFRYVVGKNDGHLYKIVYDLDKNNITHSNKTPADDNFRDEVVKKGDNNYQSKGNKIVAIVDGCTNKRVNSVDGFPPIHNSGGICAPVTIKRALSMYERFKSPEELEKMEKEWKAEYPTGIVPNPGYKSAIKHSEDKGQHAISYKVGEVDNTQTYKTTNPKAVAKGMLKL